VGRRHVVLVRRRRGLDRRVAFRPPGSTDGLTGADSTSHTYASAGLYELIASVTDDDGGSASASRQVEVLSPAEAAERAGELLAVLADDPTVAAGVRVS
jgi:hypothetical protein